jgi:hypothetical protein
LTEEEFCDELPDDEAVECHRGVGDVVLVAATMRFTGNEIANDRRLDWARLRKRAPAGRDGAAIARSLEGR